MASGYRGCRERTSCWGLPRASGWCWAHDPETAEARLENGRRAREGAIRNARLRAELRERRYAAAAPERQRLEDLNAARALLGLEFRRTG